MARNFSRDMSHHFLRVKNYFFARITHLKRWTFCESLLISKSTPTLFTIITSCLFENMISTGSSLCLERYLVEDAIPTRLSIQYEFLLLAYSGITKVIENAKDMVEKVESPLKKV